MGAWFDWLVLLQACKLSLCFSPLLFSLFLPNWNAPPSNLAADLLYCLLYPSKQAVDRFMLFVHLDHVLFFRLKCSVKQVLTANLSTCVVGAGRLLIMRGMNNITGPTDAKTEPGYKLNCTRRGTVGGAKDFPCALTT